MKAKRIAAAALAASLPLLSVPASQAAPQTTSATPSQTSQTTSAKPSQTQQPSQTRQSTSPAAPKPKPNAPGGKTQTNLRNKQVSQEMVDKYSPYVSQEGNQFRFNPPEDLKSENPQEVEMVQQIVDDTNEGIMSGKTEAVDENGNTHTIEMEPGTLEALGDHGGFKQKWWGIQFWLDGGATSALTELLDAGATTADIAAKLSIWTGIGGVSAETIASILKLGSAGIQVCNWKKNGITLNAPAGNATLAWCWPR